MANQEYPILNGVAPSWADISVRISPNGGQLIEMVDIAAINTSRAVEVGLQRGASGGRVLNRTTGQGSQEASITLYQSGAKQLYRALMQLAPVRGNQRVISLVQFQIHQQWTPLGSAEIYERIIKGCRVIGDTLNAAEGTDAQQIEVPLSVLEIADIIDGQEVVLL